MWPVSGSNCVSVSTSSCNSATNCPATPGGARFWNAITAKCYDSGVCAGGAGKTWDAGTTRCVQNSTTCTAQSDSGYSFIWSPTGVAGNPSLITTSGAGCYKAFGSGTIYATYFDTVAGAAEKIPFLDTTTNAACTSPTAGAGAFWTGDGEAAGTSGGVAFPATDKGHCMTCHDMHWHIGSTLPGAEPFRRECTTCHSHPTGEASASGAPQVDITTINHLAVAGTPMDATKYDSPCEVCHMAIESGSSAPLHLWRINADETYTTMGATQANLDADGKAWVDIDHACGQCHFAPAKNGALVRSKAVLATVAKGMHDSAAANCQVTFSIAKSGLTANVDAFVDCSPNANTDLTYDWDWGDGTTPHGTADPTSHTYAAAGAYSIKLTVKKLDLVVGAVTRSVTVTAPDNAPTVGGTACASILTADTWAATLNDTSTDDRGIMYVLVNWGDGSTPSRGAQNAALSHTYRKAGSFLITQTAVDTALQASVRTCTVSPASFRIDGTVKTSGAVAIASATVNLFDTANGVLVKTMYSTSLGAFSATSLKPGEYRITVSKRGYTFDVPAATVSVGPSKTGGTAVNIAANP